MFDESLPAAADLANLSDAELIDAAGGWARTENAACARKLAVMAEIFTRRTGLPAGQRELWWLDPEAAVATELAAAQNVTRSLALHQTHRGVALRDRLPRLAELFDAGLVSEMLVRAIVWRTCLVCDEAAMAAVDTDLAAEITSWGALSITKTEQAIDALVERHDPGALRRSQESTSNRDVQVGSPGDPPGLTSLWARLYSSDAALIDKCVQELAYSACEHDPRSTAERRADALGALVTGTDLACQCGATDCQSAKGAGPAKNAVVYVIADAAAVAGNHSAASHDAGGGRATGGYGSAGADGAENAGNNGPKPEDPRRPPSPRDGASTPATAGRPGPAFVFGAGVLPAPLLDPLLDRARLRQITHPGQAPAESAYTPSRTLADFVRCRDLNCRFPGCDVPATEADIDHTVPYPAGPTHASNLKCLCRFHHLLKTFWTGEHGWHDRQQPDGTIIWTSPTGHRYITRPRGARLFPGLRPATASIWDCDPPAVSEDTDRRGAMMPRRRHTRAANRARAIAAERRLNDDLVVERNRPPPF
ncbi:MAG: DUF222 domain-containing protein [Mycobacterium sp.]